MQHLEKPTMQVWFFFFLRYPDSPTNVNTLDQRKISNKIRKHGEDERFSAVWVGRGLNYRNTQ